MEIAVTDIKDTKIEGVTVLREETEPYRENYFEWAASPLIASFQSSQISGGILSCQTAEPQFQEFEYHKDKEFFYFVQGTALMPFANFDSEGKVNEASIQIVRIPEGTQLIIDAGKLHFVPVAEGPGEVKIGVVSPKMDSPRVPVRESVNGFLKS